MTETDLATDGRSRRPNGELYSSDPSERMRELTEDGKVGGSFGKLGGRPKKIRAAEKVAEAAKEHADHITSAFIDVLTDPEASHKMRLETAMKWLEVERKEDELQLEEDKHEDLNRDQLMERILELAAKQSDDKGEYLDGESEDLD